MAIYIILFELPPKIKTTHIAKSFVIVNLGILMQRNTENTLSFLILLENGNKEIEDQKS